MKMSLFRHIAVAAAATLGLVPILIASIINFDTFPDGSPVQTADRFTTQYSVWGVEFSDGASSGPAPSANACSYSPPNHAYAELIIATFVDPCTGIPSSTDFAGTRQDFCWVSGEGIDMYAYDANGNEIGHQFNSGGGNFASFSFPQPIIARVEMHCILQGIDDFTFNTPANVLTGDMDCNAVVNMPDIAPFVLALIDPAAYVSLHPFCDIRRADLNCDRKVDGLDISFFVMKLLS
jgi:hypothetical protein